MITIGEAVVMEELGALQRKYHNDFIPNQYLISAHLFTGVKKLVFQATYLFF